jgi:hypothetical protein
MPGQLIFYMPIITNSYNEQSFDDVQRREKISCSEGHSQERKCRPAQEKRAVCKMRLIITQQPGEATSFNKLNKGWNIRSIFSRLIRAGG